MKPFPCPLPAGGNAEGFFLWPRPGTIVTVRWIEGRPDHPVIQHVYPMGLTLPAVPDDMGRWQQRTGVHQTVDPDGNWERKTDQDILDSADNITETASGDRQETTGGSSTETVTVDKSITVPLFRVSAPTITMGDPNSGLSLLPLINSALQHIKTALDILATHTHPSVGACSQASSITTESTGLGSDNTDLASFNE